MLHISYLLVYGFVFVVQVIDINNKNYIIKKIKKFKTMTDTKLPIPRRNEISDLLLNEKMFQSGLQLPVDFEKDLHEKAKKIGISVSELRLYYVEKTELFIQKIKESYK